MEITLEDYLAERERLREEIRDYHRAGQDAPHELWLRLFRYAYYVEREYELREIKKVEVTGHLNAVPKPKERDE